MQYVWPTEIEGRCETGDERKEKIPVYPEPRSAALLKFTLASTVPGVTWRNK